MVMIKRLLVSFTFFLAGINLSAQYSDTSLWAPNGAVRSVVLRDSLLYVGGSFSQVSPVTGHFVGLDSVSAQVLSSFPLVRGRVNCMAKDSTGRIYVGGNFTAVGNETCVNLFRLDTLGNFDADFLPNPDGEVFCLEVFGDALWIGGNFLTVEGFARMRGASMLVSSHYTTLDTSSNTLISHFSSLPEDSLTDFDPLSSGPIYSMNASVNDGSVLVGGDFAGIGGCPATYLAKLNVSNGNYLFYGNSFWQSVPNVNAPVRAIEQNGDRVYVAGDFTNFGLDLRKGIAVVSKYSGHLVYNDPSNQPSYNANMNGTVRDMKFIDGNLYIAGHFSVVDGQTRRNLACIDTTLHVLSWVVNASDDVNSIELWNDSVFCIGGKFKIVNNDSACGAALVNKISTTVHAWNPVFNDNVLAVMPASFAGIVFAGGDFTGANGVFRDNLCVINVNTKRPEAWHPLVNNTVTTLYADASSLFVAGDFLQIGTNTRNRIAAFDLVSGNLNSFDPGVNGYVRTMTADGNKLYIGGNFSTTGGQTRNNLACIDISNSQATIWNPGCAGTVNKLILDGEHLYVGGFFSQTGGQFRDNLARVSTVTALADFGWSCNTDDGVYDMEMYNGLLYFGGWFQDASGQARMHLAAADTISGAPTAWNPGTDSYVRKLARWNDDLFIAGDFLTVGSSFVAHWLCNYDLGDGLYDTYWTPWPNSMPEAMATSQDWLYAGGSFVNIGNHFHPNLSRISISWVTNVEQTENQPPVPVRCWPNPAQDFIYLKLPAGAQQQIRIFDATGRMVIEETVLPFDNGSMIRIDLAGLAPGLYSVLIAGDGMPLSTGKFIRE